MTEHHIMQNGEQRQNEMCIADEATTGTLEELVQPLGRSVLSVAAVIVARALRAVGDINGPVARRRGSRTLVQLAPSDHDSSLLAQLLETNLESDLRTRDVADEQVVELGDDQAVHLPWFIRFRGHSIALGLSDEHIEGRDIVYFPTVAGLARHFLRYLAEPGMSSRWTDPLPSDLDGLGADKASTAPDDLRARWRERREQEETAAIALLKQWLRLEELPGEGMRPEQWWTQLQMAPEVHGLLATWCRWLEDRGILTVGEGLLRAEEKVHSVSGTGTHSWEQPIKDMVATLTLHAPLVRRVLTGEVPSTDLLTVPGLRPGRLAAAEPGLMPVWQRMGDLLLDRASRLPRSLEVADLGGASRENSHLDTVLDRAGAAVTVLQAGRPYTGDASFDVVLAVGSLHRWADPQDAVGTAAALLRPGGVLIAVENTELSPLGLLIAGLLENGFTDATGEPIDEPTRDEATWRRLLNAAGLLLVESTPVGPTPAVLIHAERGLDGSPQRTRPQDLNNQAGPIRSGTESEVALFWSQLLQTAPRDRSDSFFELGGDSLRATKFIAAVQRRYGITIAMRELFARPMLAAVAQRIDAAISTAGEDTQEEGML